MLEEPRLAVIYAGIATNDFCSHAAIAFHDGHFNIDSLLVDLESGQVSSTFFPSDYSELEEDGISDGDSPKSCPLMVSAKQDPPPQLTFILNALGDYAKNQKVKILAAGIDSDCSFTPQLCTSLWMSMDVIPFSFSLKGELEERADSASRKCIMWFGPDRIPRLSIVYRNQVEVDSGCIKLANLKDYQRTVSESTWTALANLTHLARENNIRFAFFNATPQGGGVALMRHSIMRILSLLNITASWHVPKPNPAVFRITKNMHNTLQGVTNDFELTDEAKSLYESWVKINCERYFSDGPFKWSDVIILDDPQVAGYIPYIKRANPNAKIIYRSHIELRADLISTKHSSQHRIWSYLWTFISQADLFVSHPIPGFIPDCIPREKVVFMPASTDLLDGLNKPLHYQDKMYWIHVFNRLSHDQMGNRLDYPYRPFICQIARFDPSKGYPDVLQSYLLFRSRLTGVDSTKVPQLVLCGHGSVDDPDGASIYTGLLEILDSKDFENIRNDICIVRVPSEDRLLNAILSCSIISMQLSCREGFEIKVTESLYKGVPMIAYKTGGIPLQFPTDYPYLVKVGQIDKVADMLYELCTDVDIRTKYSCLVKSWATKDEFYSVWQIVNWLWLILRIKGLIIMKEHDLIQTGLDVIDKEWKKYFNVLQ